MDTFIRFLYAFLSQIFLGVKSMLNGLWTGIKQVFDMTSYQTILETYKGDFSGPEWVLVVIAILFVVIIVAMIVALIYLLIRKYLKFRKQAINQDELLDEVAYLNGQVASLVKEKEEILAMKVSQLGLKPGESPTVDVKTGDDDNEDSDSAVDPNVRFSKLDQIDKDFENYENIDYGNNFTLPELCEDFRNFAASKLGLYYKIEMIRIFVSALASTKLVILQGISGTGKTSLAYAWGKFLKHSSCVASVQPSWRDRTDMFGYFNEFTKKFNETEMLKEMYIAGYCDEVFTVILDEMNLSRVEYYFAEMLSILEMPNRDEWIIELVPNSWKTDPKNIIGGKLKVPPNMWYIGTINNDDSTFAVTDKVYDRAMPIDINDKGQVFEPIPTDAKDINFSYLDNLFRTAMAENQISQETLDKIEEMDNYVIQHFRIAFGNRIVKHMKQFVPVFVACGGTEIDGVDYFIARKILRKFEQLNIAYIKEEIDPYIAFLDKTFGKNAMKECIEYLLRLKKLA